jgi:hypothetical protein
VLRTLVVGLIALVVGGNADLRAQSVLEQVQAAERRENLNTCLSGQFPTLCKRGLLSAAEKSQVDAAERRENLKTCLSGQFPTLCKRELLSPDEKTEADAAERRENLKTCLSGQFPTLCKRELLSAAEKSQGDAAERRENLKTCLSGQFPTLCKRELLNADNNAVSSASRSDPQHVSPQEAVKTPVPGVVGCAENGSCYGDISPVTGRSKTVHVDGYYRKDGTYVRGYYRSAPRK